jgi:hypothetical protein
MTARQHKTDQRRNPGREQHQGCVAEYQSWVRAGHPADAGKEKLRQGEMER